MEPVRPGCELLFSTDLSHHCLFLLINHKHRELLILNKVATCSVIGLESDASIAAEFVLFFHAQLDFDIFRGSEADLLGGDEKATFSDTSGEVEESNN